MKYIQCKLIKEFPEMGCIIHKTTWLPEQFAKKDMFIDIWELGGDWTAGWRVEEVYKGVILESDYLVRRSEDYKKQRKSSDV